MWSLSLPQLAATLAAALTAFKTKNAAGKRLIDDGDERGHRAHGSDGNAWPDIDSAVRAADSPAQLEHKVD